MMSWTACLLLMFFKQIINKPLLCIYAYNKFRKSKLLMLTISNMSHMNMTLCLIFNLLYCGPTA